MSLVAAASTVLLGALARARGHVSASDGRAVCRVVFATTLPAVMARTFASARVDATSMSVVVAGMVYGCACALTSAMVGRGRRREGSECAEGDARDALLAGSAVGLNLGNFAYAMSEVLFGKTALEMTVVFDATNQWWLLVVAHAIYTYRTSTPARAGVDARAKRIAIWASVRTSMMKQMRNPCLLAVVCTLGYRAVFGGGGFPSAVDDVLGFLAGANKTFALLALGILFEPNIGRDDLVDLASALARRYGVSMLCAGATLWVLGSTLGSLGSAVVVMCMLSPLPLLTVTYAMEFALNVTFAAALVNYANLLSGVLVLIISRLSFADPTGLAPGLVAGGVATLGLHVFLERSNRPRADASRVGVVVNACSSASSRGVSRSRAGSLAPSVAARRERTTSVAVRSFASATTTSRILRHDAARTKRFVTSSRASAPRAFAVRPVY